MLGPEENARYRQLYEDMMSSPNKFQPGDIITTYKDRPSYSTLSAEAHPTWKVISVKENGDYILQRLDTLTTTPLTPIYETLMKEDVDYLNKYIPWDARDVKDLHTRAIKAIEKEKEDAKRRQTERAKEFETKWAPQIKDSFKKHKSIQKTVEELGVDNEDVWNTIDKNELKLASDYSDVERELFGDNEYKNNRRSKKGRRRSKKGGRKTKKGGKIKKERYCKILTNNHYECFYV